ncbi:unnamed protein product [Blepharisma stoltei]|uniref:EGF-like domain-containing protein n=1 Tax=Blepharisma stoltei TaxID=1481888 RepID=A0AAU9IEX3_9CILI|nr:unnamed protein product [Blepharisma stoltei]
MNRPKECDSYTDCNEHGDCISGDCSCDLGWFGKTCTSSGIDEWGEKAWKGLVVLFSILYFLLFVLALYKLYKAIKSDKHLGINRLFVRLLRSPKHLSLFFISLIGLLRGIWISYDPLCLRNKMPRVGDRLLGEITYPILYGVYTCVLLVWGGLYQGMASKKTDPFRILRRFLLWIMILSFPCVSIMSILKGLRYSDSTVYILGSCCVGVGIVILVMGFIMFTILLFCYVDSNAGKSEEIELRFQNSIALSETQNIFLQEKREDVPSSPSPFRRSSLALFFDDSANKRNEEIGLVDGSNNVADFHNWQKQDCTWNTFESENTSVTSEIFIRDTTKHEDYNYRLHTKHGEVSHYILNLTEEDGIVFRKIIILSSLSALLGILVLLLYISYTVGNLSDNPHATLALIYIAFSLEIFSCTIIYNVFTTQIRVEAKERLNFVTRICIDNSDKEVKISYPKRFGNIGDKLYYYF